MKQGKLVKLTDALADITPETLATQARKSERLNIRVTPADKADMEVNAAALGLSLSEYLTALHHHAAARLQGRGGKGGAR